MDQQEMSLQELIEERHKLKTQLAEVKYDIEYSSAAYHEDDIQGDRYEYTENQREVRMLENDIELLDERIAEIKRTRKQFRSALERIVREELDEADAGYLIDKANKEVG